MTTTSNPTSPSKPTSPSPYRLEELDPAVAKLLLETRKTALRELLKRGAAGWDSLYQHGENVSWEHGSACPGLVTISSATWQDLLDSQALKQFNLDGNQSVLPSSGRFLVPGCGGGVDVFHLSETGTERVVVGLDVAPTCISYCKQEQEARGIPPHSIHFTTHDFLDYSSNESFDVVFDYMFLSAIPVKDRPRWASACSRVLKTGGLLLAMIYPVGDGKDGPPFEMTEEE